MIILSQLTGISIIVFLPVFLTVLNIYISNKLKKKLNFIRPSAFVLLSLGVLLFEWIDNKLHGENSMIFLLVIPWMALPLVVLAIYYFVLLLEKNIYEERN